MMFAPIGALDPNADQGVIKQANSIATPEEAFSLRQLLRGSEPAPFLADA
jgi:hypothetical protein